MKLSRRKVGLQTSRCLPVWYLLTAFQEIMIMNNDCPVFSSETRSYFTGCRTFPTIVVFNQAVLTQNSLKKLKIR